MQDNIAATAGPLAESGNAQPMSNDNQKAGQPIARTAKTAVEDPIALALQRLHNEVLTEDIPDSFMDLLDAIDAKAGTDARSDTPESDDRA